MSQTMTMTITRSGQITLPKVFRDMIGVKPGERVVVEADSNQIRVRRRMSEEEFRATLDSVLSPETKARTARIIKADRKKGIKTTRQMIDEYHNSPEAKRALEEEYGPHQSARFA